MRKWHRWIMTVFGVLLAYWAVSGLTMAIYDLTDHNQIWGIEGGGPGYRLTDDAITALGIKPPVSYTPGIVTALGTVGAMPIASVDLRMVGLLPRLQFAEANGDRATRVRFNAFTGAAMSDDVADAVAVDPSNHDFRNWIKSWHRGNIIGFTGQWIGVLTGLSLIAMVVTGVYFYFQLWNARRAIGRSGFFWVSRESIWRRLHRWTAIVSAVFVLNIAVSGVVLALGELILDYYLRYHIGFDPYPRPTPLPAQSSAPLPKDFIPLLQTSYQAALSQNPQALITSVTLVERGDGVPHGLVVLGGPAPQTLAFNAVSGAPVADWATGGVQVGQGYYADWHQIVKRIHRGDIIGSFSGRYIDITAGLCFLYLVVSSFVMYTDLFTQREKLGRKGLFW